MGLHGQLQCGTTGGYNFKLRVWESRVFQTHGTWEPEPTRAEGPQDSPWFCWAGFQGSVGRGILAHAPRPSGSLGRWNARP